MPQDFYGIKMKGTAQTNAAPTTRLPAMTYEFITLRQVGSTTPDTSGRPRLMARLGSESTKQGLPVRVPTYPMPSCGTHRWVGHIDGRVMRWRSRSGVSGLAARSYCTIMQNANTRKPNVRLPPSPIGDASIESLEGGSLEVMESPLRSIVGGQSGQAVY